ncbi:MAG: glycosyltransferase [Pseudomonadales bacterium]|nr:glycosyltransferase [Pseudomonadales bacterium]
MKISFILPCCNEEKFLARTLNRIIHITENSGHNFEIIVVDNNSSDRSLQIAKTLPVTVINFTEKCPAAVRNFGAKKASGDIYIFVDADTELPKNWLAVMLKLIKPTQVGACGGPHISACDANWLQRTWNPATIKSFEHKKSKLHGCNIAIKSKLFKQLQGFDAKLISAEDDDLSKRIITEGFDCIKSSELAVVHLGYPTSLICIFKQQYWHGSTQLKAHGFFSDKMVFISFVYCLAFLLIIIFSILNLNTLTLILTLIFISIPAIICINQFKRAQKQALLIWPTAYIIACFFITGRSFGLLKELYYKAKSASANN